MSGWGVDGFDLLAPLPMVRSADSNLGGRYAVAGLRVAEARAIARLAIRRALRAYEEAHGVIPFTPEIAGLAMEAASRRLSELEPARWDVSVELDHSMRIVRLGLKAVV